MRYEEWLEAQQSDDFDRILDRPKRGKVHGSTRKPIGPVSRKGTGTPGDPIRLRKDRRRGRQDMSYVRNPDQRAWGAEARQGKDRRWRVFHKCMARPMVFGRGPVARENAMRTARLMSARGSDMDRLLNEYCNPHYSSGHPARKDAGR